MASGSMTAVHRRVDAACAGFENLLNALRDMWAIGFAFIPEDGSAPWSLGTCRVIDPGSAIQPHKIAPDLFVAKVQCDDLPIVFNADFASSTLRPKKHHLSLLRLLVDLFDAQTRGQKPGVAATKLTGLELVTNSLLVHKVPERLMHLVISYLANHFSECWIALFLDRPESLFLCSGPDDDFRESFKYLRSHDLLAPHFRNDQEALLRDTFVLKNDDGDTLKLEEILIGPIIDQLDVIGHFVIGSIDRLRFSDQDLVWINNTTKKIMSLYQFACLERDRESKTVNVHSELMHLNELNEMLQMDFRDMELKWHQSSVANEKFKQLLQILHVLKNQPKDAKFLVKVLNYVISLTKSVTATICINDVTIMRLIFQHEERPVQELSFSELDAGIYHTMLDRQNAFIWNGRENRNFYLPSGHPRVRNCICVPLISDGHVWGSVMAANGPEHGAPDSAQGLQRFIQFLADDIRLALD